MNKGTIQASIDESATVLKKLKLLKEQRRIFHDYSDESKEIARTGDFMKIYESVINNLEYDLLLFDNSFFQFSKDDGVCRYAFIQSPRHFLSFHDFLVETFGIENLSQILLDEDTLRATFENDYEQRLSEMGLNESAIYLRYDVNMSGYKPRVHSYAHIHFGLNNEIRVPCSRILTPLSFVMFVLRHVYIAEWELGLSNGTIPARNLIFKNACGTIDKEYWTQEEEEDLYLN